MQSSMQVTRFRVLVVRLQTTGAWQAACCHYDMTTYIIRPAIRYLG